MPKHEFQMRSLILYWIILSHHFIVRYKSNAYCCCLVLFGVRCLDFLPLCLCVYVTHKGKISFAGVTMNCVFSCIKCALYRRFVAYQKRKFQHSKSSQVPVNFNEVRIIDETQTWCKTILLLFFLPISIVSSANIHNECRIVVGSNVWMFSNEWEWILTDSR